MNKEEIKKILNDKVISYLDDVLGEAYLKELTDEDIPLIQSVIEDFKQGFWYAVELFNIDIEK